MKIQKNKLHILNGTAERDLARNTFDFYIGIDPDVHQNGYAVYNKSKRALVEVTTRSFFELYTGFEHLVKLKGISNIVHIEGGWFNEQSTFGWRTGKGTAVGELIAKKVGANQQTGKLIVEMCIHLDISFVVRQPIPPRFADEQFFKMATKWIGKTNKDSRSAANYVYGF